MDFSSLNSITSNPLNLAARNNNVKEVEKLLKKTDPNCIDNRGWTCLHEAAANDSFRCLQLILKNKHIRPLAETNEGHTALYLACCYKGSFETIKALLEIVPDISNYGSPEGRTPLHISCTQGKLDIIQLLLDYGAIIDVQNFYGDTPLHDAARNTQYEAVTTLLHAGADPEIKNVRSYTAFHEACYKGCLRTVKYSFPFVSDVNQVTVNGDSPLILATHGCNDEVIQFLLANGGDADIKNKYGETALAIAFHMGQSSSFKILLNVTDYNKIDPNIILKACKPHFKLQILESLLEHDLGPYFFKFCERFSVTPFIITFIDQYLQIGGCLPLYLTSGPMNSYLNICDYIYQQSRDKFQQFFYLFLMRGVMVDALDVNECPPLVYIHYCVHSSCFSDVFQILREHGCNVDYCSYITTFKPERFMPDAFIASLKTDPSTSLVMLPYSLYCDPEYLLAFVCKYKVFQWIPKSVQDKWLSMIDEYIEEVNPNDYNISSIILPLKHLTRQKIRSIIMNTRNDYINTNQFLDILQSLRLPQQITDYLRFM